MSIQAIEGQELNSVTFVQDYLQLEFNGPALTLYHWPEVFRTEGSYAFGEPEYRDVLCTQIGESVSSTSLEIGIALEIEFNNGVILRSSLRDEDYEGPEAGQFSTGDANDPLLIF